MPLTTKEIQQQRQKLSLFEKLKGKSPIDMLRQAIIYLHQSIPHKLPSSEEHTTPPPSDTNHPTSSV